MENSLYIYWIVSVSIALVSCQSTSDKVLIQEERNGDTIKGIEMQTEKTSRDTVTESKSADTIVIPDVHDFRSETIIYYENYIGRAYSKQEYTKYIEKNRIHLDTLIKKYRSNLLELQ